MFYGVIDEFFDILDLRKNKYSTEEDIYEELKGLEEVYFDSEDKDDI